METIWNIVAILVGAVLLYAGWKWFHARRLNTKWQRNPMSLSDPELEEILKSIASWEDTYMDANVEVRSRLLLEYEQKKMLRHQIVAIMSSRRSN